MKPQNSKLDPQQALMLYKAGKLKEAMTLMHEILLHSPEYAYGWFFLSVILVQQNDLQNAEESLLTAIKTQPHYPEAYNNLGVLYDRMGKLQEAKQAYLTAVKQKPDYAQAIYNIANICKAEGDQVAAIEYYHKAIHINPNYTNALINLGALYQQAHNNDKAINLFNQALLIEPNDPTLLNNIGLSHYYRFEYNSALDYFQKALKLAPGLTSAYINIAQVLQSTGEYQAAKQYFEKASHDASFKETAFNNIALLELGLLNFKEGWEFYQNRNSIKDFRSSIPKGLSHQLDSIKILLHKDQGLGDEIFFLRFLDKLVESNASITYYTDSRLLGMLQRSLRGIEITSIKPNDTNFDLIIPIGELPRLLFDRMTSKAPPTISLKVNEDNINRLKNVIPRNGKPNIAISWQAGTPLYNKLFKRIEPTALGLMLREIDANVLILQRNASKKDIKKLENSLQRKAFNFSYINDDLEDTLACLSLIDEYVTVSNTNIHLMTALNKRVRVLVPHPAEWRWTFSESVSPWFPNVSLYRQEISGSWQKAIQACLDDLQTITRC